MLRTSNNEQRRLVKSCIKLLRNCAKALKLTRGMIGVLDALSGWERTDLYFVAHLDLPLASRETFVRYSYWPLAVNAQSTDRREL